MTPVELERGLEVHPLAELIPTMTDEEFVELRKDIESNGYREDEPLILFEGKILDGRHRDRVCRELQIEPPIQDFSGDDPTAYVISKNLHRRHLSRSQIAMTAAEALPHLEEEARKRMGREGDPRRGHNKPVPTGTPLSSSASSKRAAEEAAELTGASTRSVGRAKRVKDADPDLADQVKRGEVALATAEEKVTGRPNKDRSSGLETQPAADGRQQPTTYFGKGDKWQESTEPLNRYLAGWEKRGYEFSHINWREAAKRLKRIDHLIEGLEAARADIEPRSHKAKLSF